MTSTKWVNMDGTRVTEKGLERLVDEAHRKGWRVFREPDESVSFQEDPFTGWTDTYDRVGPRRVRRLQQDAL